MVKSNFILYGHVICISAIDISRPINENKSVASFGENTLAPYQYCREIAQFLSTKNLNAENLVTLLVFRIGNMLAKFNGKQAQFENDSHVKL